MVEAFTRIRTSPCPGDGTGTVRISTVLFPGKNAACIVFPILPFSSMFQLREWSVINGS
jgi:hypothetical protein